ncbi:MAG TPA: 50S ribosomal protein L21 [Leptospiraceae bacterium]|nr:50S ribosomal protein L21 [Leptospiraceae bacterium]HNL03180.1 50S ribosomal protein L21 [Leptospiraceae bacterium]HNL69794.1 50S ribosomal protein L21 [Leptospiraceae bacterium]HNN73089.1 50S ribosomal protein L21 [Leptospiraceae bacterium]
MSPRGFTMYAIIQIAGHQHKVKENDVILTDLTGHDISKEFKCEDVIAVGEGESLKVGAPFVKGASVSLKVLEDTRSPKISGMHYKKRKGIRRHWGHRQDLQKLQVLKIQG